MRNIELDLTIDEVIVLQSALAEEYEWLRVSGQLTEDEIKETFIRLKKKLKDAIFIGR